MVIYLTIKKRQIRIFYLVLSLKVIFIILFFMYTGVIRYFKAFDYYFFPWNITHYYYLYVFSLRKSKNKFQNIIIIFFFSPGRGGMTIIIWLTRLIGEQVFVLPFQKSYRVFFFTSIESSAHCLVVVPRARALAVSIRKNNIKVGKKTVAHTVYTY